jgi:hypothetical protein
LNYQVACHGSLWRFWLRGTSADEHRKCDEGLDGTFHLCHIFRREAPEPAMLHALKLWVDPFTISLSPCIGGQNLSLEPLPPCLHLRPLLRQLLNTVGFHAGKMPPNAPRRTLAFALRDSGQLEAALLHSN